jgi:hypothetical protein
MFVWKESDKERKRFICEMTKLTLHKIKYGEENKINKIYFK